MIDAGTSGRAVDLVAGACEIVADPRSDELLRRHLLPVLLVRVLVDAPGGDEAVALAIEAAAAEAVAQGIDFAKASPAPTAADVTRYVYAEARE